jgi:hypothetical protein
VKKTVIQIFAGCFLLRSSKLEGFFSLYPFRIPLKTVELVEKLVNHITRTEKSFEKFMVCLRGDLSTSHFYALEIELSRKVHTWREMFA